MNAQYWNEYTVVDGCIGTLARETYISSKDVVYWVIWSTRNGGIPISIMSEQLCILSKTDILDPKLNTFLGYARLHGRRGC